jgi:hypothetical protein
MVIHVERGGWHWGWCWLLLGGLLLAGCFPNKCRTQPLYEGNPVSEGTITYGEPPISRDICAGPAKAGVSCMQAPDACTSPSFGSEGCTALILDVAMVRFQNGQVVALPSPDVTVAASLDDLYAHLPYDAGYGKEELTLVSGTVSVTISLNNFDAHFDMVFTRPNGDSVVIQNGRAALLRALWTNVTSCED